MVDQSAIRGSRRSNPATYTGLLDPIRTAFAKANGVKASLFSANSEGACPKCKGLGVDLHRPGDDGRRRVGLRRVRGQAVHAQGARRYKLRGKNISEVLAHVRRRGAGVLHHGQPQGDPRPARRRRPRLPDAGAAADHVVRWRAAAAQAGDPHGAARAARRYVLDEPTTGLHLADVDQLLGCSTRCRRREHGDRHRAPPGRDGARRLAVDLGPGAGHDGGEVVFTGTPAALVAAGDTLTARHLREYLGAA